MLHTFGLLLSFLTAALLGLVFLPHTPAILALLSVAVVVLTALMSLLFPGHRRGGLEQVLNLVHGVPLFNRLARRLEPKRATLAAMDEQITQCYHANPRRFFQALALEYVSRCLFLAEYLLIALSAGVHLAYAQAHVIAGLAQPAQNVIFVARFEVGTKEGSLYL